MHAHAQQDFPLVVALQGEMVHSKSLHVLSVLWNFFERLIRDDSCSFSRLLLFTY